MERSKLGQDQLRIVVAGPAAAGKTSFIRSISEFCVLAGEAAGSQVGQPERADFGRIRLANGLTLNLFGLPSELPRTGKWANPGSGMIGMVLVIDGSRPHSLPGARELAVQLRRDSRMPAVVAVTHVDRLDEVSAQRLRNALGLSQATPVVRCDARDRKDVRDALVALLTAILDALERDAMASGAGS